MLSDIHSAIFLYCDSLFICEADFSMVWFFSKKTPTAKCNGELSHQLLSEFFPLMADHMYVSWNPQQQD